jgi:hypothetical protein
LLDKFKNTGVKKEYVLNAFFFLFLGIIILHRIILFFSIKLDYIDNDEVVIWLGAKHYSEGLFYVPRFYGQSYHTMMDALFSVPLIKSGVPVYYAVPILTQLIYLTPFVFSASYLFYKKKKQTAIIVLCIMLCMPIGYDIMNTITRGFANGLFFSTFLIVSLHNPHNKIYIGVNLFMAYVGYLVLPNSVLVTLPILFYLFLLNYKDKLFYVASAVAIICGMPIDYLLNHFYKIHPEAEISKYKTEFGFNYLIDSIKHLNAQFTHIGFFVEESAMITLIVFGVLGVFLFKKSLNHFYAFLVFICVLLLGFSTNKSMDGSLWPFYSYSRLYLGIPIIIYLFIAMLNPIPNKFIYFICFITVGFTVFKYATFKQKIAYHVDEKKWDHLNLISLKDLKGCLEIYKNQCQKNNVTNLLIVDHVWRDDFINYAGPALYNDYPNTFKPSFERRSWRIAEEKNRIHSTFQIYSANWNLDSTFSHDHPDINITRIDNYGSFLIKNNPLTTLQFLKKIGATMEGF